MNHFRAVWVLSMLSLAAQAFVSNQVYAVAEYQFDSLERSLSLTAYQSLGLLAPLQILVMLFTLPLVWSRRIVSIALAVGGVLASGALAFLVAAPTPASELSKRLAEVSGVSDLPLMSVVQYPGRVWLALSIALLLLFQLVLLALAAKSRNRVVAQSRFRRTSGNQTPEDESDAPKGAIDLWDSQR